MKIIVYLVLLLGISCRDLPDREKVMFCVEFWVEKCPFSGLCLVISFDIFLNLYKSINIPDLVSKKDIGVS